MTSQIKYWIATLIALTGILPLQFFFNKIPNTPDSWRAYNAILYSCSIVTYLFTLLACRGIHSQSNKWFKKISVSSIWLLLLGSPGIVILIPVILFIPVPFILFLGMFIKIQPTNTQNRISKIATHVAFVTGSFMICCWYKMICVGWAAAKD